VAAISAQHEMDLHKRKPYQSLSVTDARNTSKTIEDFRSNPRYGGDETRVDLAFAIYALSHGASDDQVAAILRHRDLSHKGDEKRQHQYVDRTITKAFRMVEIKSRS
jgi:hypothetical protein